MILFLGEEGFHYKLNNYSMRKVVFTLLMIVQLCVVYGQNGYTPSLSNLENRKWFEESRFGVFIHWGVYSVLGDGEWVMNNQKFGLEEYSLLPSFFNPIAYDAKEWAKIFKKSGAKYVTFTSRHHDGFSLWHTKQSNYNIVDATPFKRDVLKELTDACREEGLKVMFYYSLLDWKRDDYLPAGKTGKDLGGRDSSKGDWDSYINFMKAQLTELLTDYGTIDGIWFDGHWDKPDENWRYEEIYSLIHSIQPQCLVGNNHHMAPIPGEDFQMFERDLPGQNLTGFGTKQEDVGSLPKEVCGTIAGSWGFDIKDRQRKSFNEVLSYLINAASYDANLLLNVGPMPNGKIQDYQIERLLELGSWLEKYGESIYGSSGGKIPGTNHYAFTKKNKECFLHVLDPSLKELEIKNFIYPIKEISSFNKESKIKYEIDKDKLKIRLPHTAENEVYVLRIKIK